MTTECLQSSCKHLKSMWHTYKDEWLQCRQSMERQTICKSQDYNWEDWKLLSNLFYHNIMLSQPWISEEVKTILTNWSRVGCLISPHLSAMSARSWSLSWADPFNGVKFWSWWPDKSRIIRPSGLPLKLAWCWGLRLSPLIRKASSRRRNIIVPSLYNLYSNL